MTLYSLQLVRPNFAGLARPHYYAAVEMLYNGVSVTANTPEGFTSTNADVADSNIPAGSILGFRIKILNPLSNEQSSIPLFGPTAINNMQFSYPLQETLTASNAVVQSLGADYTAYSAQLDIEYTAVSTDGSTKTYVESTAPQNYNPVRALPEPSAAALTASPGTYDNQVEAVINIGSIMTSAEYSYFSGIVSEHPIRALVRAVQLGAFLPTQTVEVTPNASSSVIFSVSPQPDAIVAVSYSLEYLNDTSSLESTASSDPVETLAIPVPNQPYPDSIDASYAIDASTFTAEITAGSLPHDYAEYSGANMKANLKVVMRLCDAVSKAVIAIQEAPLTSTLPTLVFSHLDHPPGSRFFMQVNLTYTLANGDLVVGQLADGSHTFISRSPSQVAANATSALAVMAAGASMNVVDASLSSLQEIKVEGLVGIEATKIFQNFGTALTDHSLTVSLFGISSTGVETDLGYTIHLPYIEETGEFAFENGTFSFQARLQDAFCVKAKATLTYSSAEQYNNDPVQSWLFVLGDQFAVVAINPVDIGAADSTHGPGITITRGPTNGSPTATATVNDYIVNFGAEVHTSVFGALDADTGSLRITEAEEIKWPVASDAGTSRGYEASIIHQVDIQPLPYGAHALNLTYLPISTKANGAFGSYGHMFFGGKVFSPPHFYYLDMTEVYISQGDPQAGTVTSVYNIDNGVIKLTVEAKGQTEVTATFKATRQGQELWSVTTATLTLDNDVGSNTFDINLRNMVWEYHQQLYPLSNKSVAQTWAYYSDPLVATNLLLEVTPLTTDATSSGDSTTATKEYVFAPHDIHGSGFSSVSQIVEVATAAEVKDRWGGQIISSVLVR
jgi:hypothetical protein